MTERHRTSQPVPSVDVLAAQVRADIREDLARKEAVSLFAQAVRVLAQGGYTVEEIAEFMQEQLAWNDAIADIAEMEDD